MESYLYFIIALSALLLVFGIRIFAAIVKTSFKFCIKLPLALLTGSLGLFLMVNTQYTLLGLALLACPAMLLRRRRA